MEITVTSPRNQNTTSVGHWNVAVGLRRIPGIPVLQPLRFGFGREGCSIKFSNQIVSRGAIKNPARVLRVAIHGDLEKIRAFAVAGKIHIAEFFPLLRSE